MPITKRLTRRYQVARDDVTLRIIVGDGQIGTSLVKVDGVELASGHVAMVRLGAGNALKGATARVITTVTDVQRGTNHTSIRYVLSGGVDEATFDTDADVPRDGGSVQYIARFRFE